MSALLWCLWMAAGAAVLLGVLPPLPAQHMLTFVCLWAVTGGHLTAYAEEDDDDVLLRVLGLLMAPRWVHAHPVEGHASRRRAAPEGLARLTHAAGWTALSFWDRSVDHRGGSHSTFVAEGTFTFEEMVAEARRLFPTIWQRYTFDVRLALPAHHRPRVLECLARGAGTEHDLLLVRDGLYHAVLLVPALDVDAEPGPPAAGGTGGGDHGLQHRVELRPGIDRVRAAAHVASLCPGMRERNRDGLLLLLAAVHLAPDVLADGVVVAARFQRHGADRTPRMSEALRVVRRWGMHLALHPDSHLDHGLSPAHVEILVAAFATMPSRDGVVIRTVELPHDLPPLESRLYGPVAGDAPVEEAEARYVVRPGRRWASRVVDRPARPSRLVTVVAGPHDGLATVLFTAYGGPEAPREPGDPSLEGAALEEARRFWTEHALAILLRLGHAPGSLVAVRPSLAGLEATLRCLAG